MSSQSYIKNIYKYMRLDATSVTKRLRLFIYENMPHLSTCRTSPSVRNGMTSDDGSRKTGAPNPEGIRLEIIEGPRCIPRIPPRSLAPSFRMHRMRDVRSIAGNARMHIANINLRLLSRRQISTRRHLAGYR